MRKTARCLFWLARHAAKVYVRLMVLGIAFVLAGGQVNIYYPQLLRADGSCCVGQPDHR